MSSNLVWLPGRFWRISLSLVVVLIILVYIYLPYEGGVPSARALRATWKRPLQVHRDTLESLATEAAGNSTLGFDSIHFVNLKGRFDRVDAMSLQAYLSGVDVTLHLGVEPDEVKDLGMPPTHKPGSIPPKAMACWRAHANIWAMMLRESLPAAIILEADAAWDTNIRDIMANLSKHFTQFLSQLNSTAIPRSGWKARHAQLTSDQTDQTMSHNPQDPWHSEHWDMLQIGHCVEQAENQEINLIFPDEHVPPGTDYYGRTLGNERVFRKSGTVLCATAYAISQTGAAKLLLRTALDLDRPVDVMIAEMIRAGDLVSYSVFPMVMAQWKYAKDVGMELRKANSDIDFFSDTEQSAVSDDEAQKKGWEAAWEAGSVWIHKTVPGLENIFEDMTLPGAWKRIMGNSSIKSTLA